MTEKEAFLNIWKQEFAITKKLIEHYPVNKLDLKPTEVNRSAKELIAVFVQAHGLLDAALRGKLDMGAFPEVAGTLPEILAQFEAGFQKDYEQVRAMPQADWDGTMEFMVGKDKMATVRRADILWLVVHDWIHHRGQLSIYMRIAGAKVPSIYGPSADEPWH